MPTVPRYQQQVRESAIAGNKMSTDAPIEAFGGGAAVQSVATAASRLTDTISDFAFREAEKANELAVLDATRQLAVTKTDLIYNTETGAMTRKGKDAFGVPDEYGKQFKDKAEQIEQGLASFNQRAAFRKQAADYEVSLNDQLTRHVLGEAEKYDNEVTESAMSVAANEGIVNFGDAVMVQKSVEQQQKIIRDFAVRTGKSPEWLQEKLTERSTATHSEVINRFLSTGDDQLASQHYALNRDQIAGKDAGHIEKVLEEGSLRGNSQRISEQVLSQTSSKAEALKAAAAMAGDNPKLKDEATRRVESDFDRMFQAKQHDRRQRMESHVNLLEKNGGNVDEIPAQQWAAYDHTEKNILRGLAKNKAEGVAPSTDWIVYTQLKQKAMNDPRGFAKEDPLNYINKLAPTEYKEVLNLYDKVRSGKGDAEIKTIRQRSEIVDDATKKLGLKKGSNKANEFEAMLDQRYAEFQVDNGGRQMNGIELQKLTDKMTKEVVTKKGFLWDDKKPVYNVEYKDVPPAETVKIRRELKKQGHPETPRNITEMYRRKLGQ